MIDLASASEAKSRSPGCLQRCYNLVQKDGLESRAASCSLTAPKIRAARSLRLFSDHNVLTASVRTHCLQKKRTYLKSAYA